LDQIEVSGYDGMGSENPDITVDQNGYVYFVWADWKHWGAGNTNTEIYYAKFDSSGNEISRRRISYSDGYSQMPQIVIDNAGVVHIVWQEAEDNRDMGPYHPIRKLYHYRLGSGMFLMRGIPSGGELIEENSDSSRYPKIDFDSENNIHVVWRLSSNEFAKAYYKKINTYGTELIPRILLPDDYRMSFYVGRINAGVSVSDVSSLIMRSVFYDDLFANLYNEGEYRGMSIGRYAYGDYNSLIAESIKDTTTRSGYDSDCSTDSSNYNCEHRGTYGSEVPPYLEHRNFITFADHGGPYSWEHAIRSNDIPYLDLSWMDSMSCSTANTWEEGREPGTNTFSTTSMRKGAIAYHGSTGTTYAPGLIELIYAMEKITSGNNLTLGEINELLSSNSYYFEHYTMLGDPTLVPKFGVVNWEEPAPIIKDFPVTSR
jgi:hypothetical protein